MSGKAEIEIRPEDAQQPDVTVLFATSDAYHAALYPAESNHLVGVDEFICGGAIFLVARSMPEGTAVGCGGVVARPGGYGEIKRMWIKPGLRGLGLGRRMLEALEAAARARGLWVLRLETGIRQPEAVGLYWAAGYMDCGPFGDYAADPLSLFLEKKLD